MRSKFIRILELSSREWRWLFLSIVLLPVVALSIRRSGWMATMDRFRPRRVIRGRGVNPLAAARMVRIAATHGPVHVRCLPRAVVLWALLRRHGIRSELKLGVRKSERGVDAHAWVELEGVPLDQSVEDGRFVPLRAVAVS